MRVLLSDGPLFGENSPIPQVVLYSGVERIKTDQIVLIKPFPPDAPGSAIEVYKIKSLLDVDLPVWATTCQDISPEAFVALGKATNPNGDKANPFSLERGSETSLSSYFKGGDVGKNFSNPLPTSGGIVSANPGVKVGNVDHSTMLLAKNRTKDEDSLEGGES